MAQSWDRRTVLRTLGLGAAGISVGGLGVLTGCSSGAPDRATSASVGSSTTTTAARSPRSLIPYDPKTPYWEQGNFAAVTTEETATALAVKGAIPSGLSGLFVRNGSNPPTGKSLHWFLGDGMVHGVRIKDGRAAWYRNRYVQTPLHKAHEDLGVPGKANNQSNVALVHHGGKLLTTGEVGWPFELDTKDLSTVGPWDYDGRLGETMTAHPKIDPSTGRMHFFGYEFLRPAITYYAADPTGRLDVVSPIRVDTATMVHDFAVTDRDAIFWVGPVVFGADARNPNPSIPFHWDPSGPSKVGVMPLDGSGDDIRWVDVPLGFAFHGLNAHREGDDVVIHLHRLAQAFGPKGDLVPSFLTEWRIGTSGRDLTFSEQRVSDRRMDLPAHDRRHTGRKIRHGWFATTTLPSSEHGFELAGICHLDMKTGREDVWNPGPDRRAGEGFFVAADKAEGDGWVFSYVWDRTTDTSVLAIFDAQAMKQGPVAEIQLPARVPFGFHGLWVDESVL